MNLVYKTPYKTASWIWSALKKIAAVAAAMTAISSVVYGQVEGDTRTQGIEIGAVSWPSDFYKKNANWQYAADVIIYNLDPSQYAVRLAGEAAHLERGIRIDGLALLRATLEMKVSSIAGQPHAKLELRSKTKLTHSESLLEIVLELVPHVGGNTAYRELSLVQGQRIKLNNNSTVPIASESGSLAASQRESEFVTISASTPINSGMSAFKSKAKAQKAAMNKEKIVENEQSPIHQPKTIESLAVPSVTPVFKIQEAISAPSQPALTTQPSKTNYADWMLANVEPLLWLLGLSTLSVLFCWGFWRWWKRVVEKKRVQNARAPIGYGAHPEDALNTVFGDPMDHR